MTNEEKLIVQIKKNLLQLDTIKEEDLDNQLNKFKAHPESLKDFFELSDEKIDWGLIKERIQEQVAVEHDRGFGIVDDKFIYNTSWFSEYLRSNSRGYYWGRFIDKQSEKLPPNVMKTVREDTEAILNRCGAPDRIEVKDIRGLVFGYVQSGKTLNYTSLANAAMDCGYHIVIILAGATKILRKQTQDRVNSDVIGWDGSRVVGVGVNEDMIEKRPISLTTSQDDFDKKIANQQLQGTNLSNTKTPTIAVIKKNVYSIKHLNNWLSVQNRKGKIKKSVLVIDDESDYASVNTKKNEDPTAINKGLRTMLNYFEVSTYVAITATPFANILINSNNENEDLGQDLFPKSFIWSLNKPSTYSGVKEVVIDSFKSLQSCDKSLNKNRKLEICEEILRFKIDDSFNELPYFVDEALSTFLSDLYKLRTKRPDQDDVSMMINISRFTNHHQQLSGLLEQKKDKLIDSIRSLSHQQFKDPVLLLLRKKNEHLITQIGERRFWEEILKQLLFTKIIGVHSKSSMEIEFSEGKKINFILIGGLSLSRGFTIEGLITSVFLRSTRTYDALMQMGRWFGHKSIFKDLGVLSLFTTEEIQSRYETIQEATEDLLKQIQVMKERKETPREFGLGIKFDPLAALQVVAHNKARSATKIKVNLGMNGRMCETTRLYTDKEIISKNKVCIESFLQKVQEVGKIFQPSGNIYFPNNQKNPFAYSEIDSHLVVSFLETFEIPFKKLTQVSPRLPYPILIDYLEQKIEKVDVVIIQGGSSETLNFKNIGEFSPSGRKFETRPGGYIKQTGNNITKPTDEGLLLTKQDPPPVTRKEYRELRAEETDRPLLMIYPLIVSLVEDNEEVDKFENYAWCISTPGKNDDDKGKLVYANNVLLNILEEEDDSYFLDNETDEE